MRPPSHLELSLLPLCVRLLCCAVLRSAGCSKLVCLALRQTHELSASAVAGLSAPALNPSAAAAAAFAADHSLRSHADRFART